MSTYSVFSKSGHEPDPLTGKTIQIKTDFWKTHPDHFYKVFMDEFSSLVPDNCNYQKIRMSFPAFADKGYNLFCDFVWTFLRNDHVFIYLYYVFSVRQSFMVSASIFLSGTGNISMATIFLTNSYDS